MKRTVPLLIAAVCGVVLIITAFIPATVTWGETATVWFDVLAAIAFILGGGNLLKIHLKKVSDRAAGWAYSLITVLTFLVTLWVGMAKFGSSPASDQEYFGQTFVTLPLEQLPQELRYRLDVDLPADLFDEELPSSIRRQFKPVLGEGANQDRIVALEFLGWPTSFQSAAMMNFHELLEWRSAIENLLKLAVPPADVRGSVSYLADHRALSATGVLSSEQQAVLKTVSAEPRWQTAVDELGRLSNRTTTVALNEIPETVQNMLSAAAESKPAALQNVSLTGSDLTVTGPLVPPARTALTDVFARVRPMTEGQIDQFIQELDNLDGELTESEVNLLRGLCHSLWNHELLSNALNEAGKSRPGTKTYTQLLEEKQAGSAELNPVIPASGEDVELNAAQLDYLKNVVTDPAVDLQSIGATLKDLGPWTGGQEARLQTFLASQPTVGQWKRSLASSLTTKQRKLSAEQYAFLLADYKAEHFWNAEVYNAFKAAHQVKYPWSGGYSQDGTPFWWSYEYALKPLTATMFALLAFYVASAAFRAFRAKNFEAFLLLATAFIILLGRTYAGVLLTAGLPESLAFLKVEEMTMFIMSVINAAGNRAIMIGIALGVVSTSLKILLGVDRSYLGSSDS